jgi:hypothetical protein
VRASGLVANNELQLLAECRVNMALANDATQLVALRLIYL